MARSKTEWTLEAVNERLRAARAKVAVEQRGEMLWMRATLPPKPGSDRPFAYQQRISLGIPASEDGFRKAEQEARLLGGLLVSEKFDWANYLNPAKLPQTKPARLWIEEFRVHYMQTHTLKPATWTGHFQKIYKRLPPNEPITQELLIALVHKTERNSRNRRETCEKLQALAAFMGLDVNLIQYKGQYKPRSRDVPSDEAIALWRDKIPNPAWRWVYGVMAAFGLRDHEAFFCHWEPDGLFVEKGKTGPRLVYQALYPEWVEQWDLRNVCIPKVQDIERVYERGKLGDKVAKQFRRYKVPFAPYNLRHAYGIRSSVTFGLSVTTAAELMGHDPDIHLRKYHRHIKLKDNQAAAKRIMERPDRPKAPEIRQSDDSEDSA